MNINSLSSKIRYQEECKTKYKDNKINNLFKEEKTTNRKGRLVSPEKNNSSKSILFPKFPKQGTAKFGPESQNNSMEAQINESNEMNKNNDIINENEEMNCAFIQDEEKDIIQNNASNVNIINVNITHNRVSCCQIF